MDTIISKLTLAVTVAVALLTTGTLAQDTYSNRTVVVTASDLRDRLYDATTASTLSKKPIHAAVIHLLDEATRLNPGILSTSNTVDVMQKVIARMTNDFGNNTELCLHDLTSLALPYLQTELTKKLPSQTVTRIQTGLSILVVAEQQGRLFSSVYSNLTTALPSGAVFAAPENTAASLQTLQRQAASRVTSLSLPERIRTAADPAFRTAAAEVLSPLTSVKPDDSLDAIFQAIPGLTNSQFFHNMVQAAQTAGVVVTDVRNLVTSFTNTLAALHQAVSDNSAALGQIADQQPDIFGSPSLSSTIRDAQDVARRVSFAVSNIVDTSQQTITLASTLIKIAGDPELAQKVVTVGGSAVKVAQTVQKIADVISSDGLFSLAGAAATGNFIGVAVDMLSVFGGGGGPSPDQVILDQIGAVRQDIATLRAEMHERFDRVDAALTNIMDKIDYNLFVMTNDFNYVANNLDQIRSQVLDLQGQVQNLEGQIYSWMTAQDQQDLYLLLHASLGYEDRVGLPMAYNNGGAAGDFVSYANQYWLWAYYSSQNALYQPVPTTYPNSVSDSDLYSQLSIHNAPEENVTFINNFLQNRLQQQLFSGTLANPRIWSLTANGLSQMCLENPAWFRRLGIKSDLGQVLQVGNNLNTFVNRLVAFNTNSPNTNLWISACGAYRAAIQDFTNAVLNSISNYNISHSLPAGSNPFVDKSLNLLTPRSTNMLDGYYPSASVVSVTAIACSPTSDGLPIYFLDQNTLRSLDAYGMITTLAGSPTNAGFRDGFQGLLNNPQSLVVASNGAVYISDAGNHAIRQWTSAGHLTTLAGYIPGTNNATPVSGATDGTKGNARFNSPHGIIQDAIGNLLVADTMNHAIRQVTLGGVVTTFAGTLGLGGIRPGLTVAAARGTNSLLGQFWMPQSLSLATNAEIHIANFYDRRAWTIGTNGSVTGGSPHSIAVSSYYDADGTTQANGVSLAVRQDGTVAAWGFNDSGQTDVPPGLSNVVAVATSYSGGSLALTSSGNVVGWGATGQLSVAPPATNVVAIAADVYTYLALRADGVVVAWDSSAAPPTAVPGWTNVVAISASGYGHSMALAADGTVLDSANPPPVGLHDVVAVAAGGWNGSGAFSLALKKDGTVTAWAAPSYGNNYGQCNVPVGLSNVVEIAASYDFSIALKADGTLVSWGHNRVVGMYDYGWSPCVLPSGLKDVANITVSWCHALAVQTNGTAVGWGINDYGAINIPAGLSLSRQTPPTLPTALGTTTPDGRTLSVDSSGLHLYDNSDPQQHQVAQYLVNELSNAGGTLRQKGNTLMACHRLLQNMATYALNSFVANDDASHTLLFGSDCLIDSTSATSFLNGVVTKADWRPIHTDLGTVASQRIDALQSRLVDAIIKASTKSNPANLPIITDTINRLNLLLATHDSPVPPPTVNIAPSTNRLTQVVLNGYPYVHYNLQSSPDLRNWLTNAASYREGGFTNMTTTGTPARFYRAVQAQ